MHKVLLGLGSNLGDRECNLTESIKNISNLENTSVIQYSNIYETPPVGYVEQEDFLNMVIEIETLLEPTVLLSNLLRIEMLLNRERTIRWGPRTIDLDILTYGNEIINLPNLTVPHPRMFQRAFVLKPLRDIYKREMLYGQNVMNEINKCEDIDGIRIYKKTNDLFKLRYLLNTEIIGRDLLYFDEIDSTNVFAKKISSVDQKDGLIIIANKQKNGRGRLGRDWDSKKDDGIWMSLLLKPNFDTQYKHILPLITSLAVVEGIKEATSIKATIKWPNDIIIAGRKVCGILFESSMGNDEFQYIVGGIGINVNQGEFSEELKEKAISLRMYADKEFDRGVITVAILEKFEYYYLNIEKIGIRNIITKYKESAITIGSQVKIMSSNKEFSGLAVDINKKGNLVVLDEQGLLREVHSGEVSVRGVQGYT
jgi:BirA family biotin operon repressor/biotin-[acetyl-CoA-carboxylase] ligase